VLAVLQAVGVDAEDFLPEVAAVPVEVADVDGEDGAGLVDGSGKTMRLFQLRLLSALVRAAS
jgi:hypothetical protein